MGDHTQEQVDRAGGMAIGGTFACLQAADDDHVFCRGDDHFGQLGGSHSVPDADGGPERSGYVPGIAPALWLNAGTWHACAVANTVSDYHTRYVHRVACWGRGDYGQLSAPATDRCEMNGAEVGCAKTPVLGIEFPDIGSFAIGDLYTCVNSTRGISCWGANRDGFFGEPGSCPASLKSAWPTLRTPEPAPRAACSPKPVRLPHVFDFHSWVRAGPRGLCTDGDDGARCFGAIPTPVAGISRPIPSPGRDAAACALAADGVVCWGEGYSPRNAPATPVAVGFEPLPDIGSVYLSRNGNPHDWSASCLVNRGCGFGTLPILPCAPDLEVRAVESLEAETSELVGRRVSVRGPLSKGPIFSTAMECVASDGRGCCNQVGGPVLIGPVGLEGLFCGGDDSALCCNAPADGRIVVATGILAPHHDVSEVARWKLAHAELCSPREN
jgi:hypothetical protein